MRNMILYHLQNSHVKNKISLEGEFKLISGAKCFVSRRIGAILMSGYEQENVQFEQRAAWGSSRLCDK